MKKVYLLGVLFLMKLAVFAQPQQVNIQVYQGCNGATITPFVIWAGTPVPVTVHFERQGAGGTWFNVVSQVYDVQTSYIVVSPTDISAATTYRIRAVDMTTLIEYISSGGVVNPATWGVNRGTPFVSVTSGWGTDCSGLGNSINVGITSTTNGRPPYRVEYKPSTQANYLVAGEVNGFISIPNIIPGTAYQVRVVDYCGNVTAPQNTALSFTASAVQLRPATACDNGTIQAFAIGGVAPYEYGIGKVHADMTTALPDFAYRSSNNFDSLAPGDYFVRVRDACGNLSNTGFIRLGGGFPRLTSARSIPAGDSCSRNLTVTVTNGDGPFEYGIRYMLDANYSWQTSNVFTNLTRIGVYYLRVKDKCGQLSDSVLDNIGAIPTPVVDSVTTTNLPGCEQSVKVYGSGGYLPLEYSKDLQNWKATDTFNNLLPGFYGFWVRDRCGRVSLLFNHQIPQKQLTPHIRTGLDSCGVTTAFISIDSVTGNAGPYLYAILNQAAPPDSWTPFGSDSIFRGLTPGDYSVWVRGACGSEEIVENLKVGSNFTFDYSLQPNVLGCSDFVIINLHNALKPPFVYFLTNGVHKRRIETSDSSFVLTDFPAGTYTITITDACGDTADLIGSPLEITASSTPQISYEVQYLNGCIEANIIVHGAPDESLFRLQPLHGGFFERADSVFRGADYNIISGKYIVTVLNSNICGGNYTYTDTVVVGLAGTVLSGTVDPAKPTSYCIYHLNAVKLADHLLEEYAGGTWASTAPQGFDAVNGTFIPSQAGEGQYEFTYSITDSCGSLHETSVFINVTPDACTIRSIAGDYHTVLQPAGCVEITGGFDYYHFTDNQGNLIFSINPLGRYLGPVCAGVRIVDGNGSSLRSTVIDGRPTYFLDRNFYINAFATFGSSPVEINLYLTNEEVQNMLDFLHNNGYPGASVSDIRILQKSGDDVDLQVTNEGALDPSRFTIITPTMGQNANGWVMYFTVTNFSEFNPHFTGTTGNLPLTLLDFNGTNNNGKVRLQWRTTDESNTSHFEVERSADGNTFQSIGRVYASGNTSGEKTYSHDDLNPLTGNNFYRLKMADIDGQFTYSKTILIRSGKIPGIKLTPNPAHDHLYISTPGNTKATAIRIYDATGRLLYNEKVNGNQLLKVQTMQLRNGWYMLELQTATGTFREGFLKQ